MSVYQGLEGEQSIFQHTVQEHPTHNPELSFNEEYAKCYAEPKARAEAEGEGEEEPEQKLCVESRDEIEHE
jgi:hypothetical protein